MFNHPFAIITSDETSIHFLSFRHALIAATKTARKRVWILSYVINANLNRQGDPITHFFSILRTRHSAGCDIKIILDNPQINRPNYHCNKYIMRRLMEWQIPFRTPPPRVTSHAKAILIDSSVLFIGSHNLAKSSLLNPLDCTVELRNSFLIQSFAKVYTELWKHGSMVSYMPDDLPTIAHNG